MSCNVYITRQNFPPNTQFAMYSGGGDQIPAMTYPDLSGDEYEAALPYFWSQLSPNSRQKFVELCKLEGTTSISPSSGEDAPMDGDFIMSNDSSATSSAMFDAAVSPKLLLLAAYEGPLNSEQVVHIV